jgi:hypothetical protein
MATGRPANAQAPVPEVPADMDTLKPKSGTEPGDEAGTEDVR